MHDVYALLERDRDGGAVAAELCGVVSDVRPHGSIRFLDLVDTTGRIQLRLDRGRFDDDTWTRARALKKGHRITAIGLVADDGRQYTLDVSEFTIGIERRFVPDGQLTPDTHRSALSTRYLLARLRSRATEAFTDWGYEEFEPNYISASRIKPAVEPLEVRFPGWGTNEVLAPSPAPQLLEAIITGGSPKVFSIARSFWTGIRDGFTSAEKLVLVARHLNGTMAELEDLAEQAVRRVLGHFTTMPLVRDSDWLEGPPWPRSRTSPLESSEPPRSPELRRGAISTDPPCEGFRLRWPALHAASPWSPPTLTLAEGHIELLGGELPVACLTLNLERMTALLSEAPLFRMRDLIGGLGPVIANAE